MNYEKIIKDFLSLQDSYQFTRRNLMTKERFRDFVDADPKKGLDLDNVLLNEPLIEHVGHLPIVASYFHQFLEHKDEVDLGRVLTMLSIHDIGETVLGDIFTYTKTEADEEEEVEVALTLLPKYLQEIFLEYEALETFDAKYAKSVDALAGFLPALDMPRIILKRFKKRGACVKDVIDRKGYLMEWDTTMKAVFDLGMTQARQAENNEPLLFGNVEYDIPVE
jgi:5'-deoxynucleotidase YfbR-like HD superfamily hydrolase